MEREHLSQDPSESQPSFKGFIRECLRHPEILAIDAVILGLAAYTIAKFITGEPVDGPPIVITGGGTGGAYLIRTYLEARRQSK